MTLWPCLINLATNSDPIKPGKDLAKAFKNYLQMGQNAGGFTTTNVIDAPIAKFFRIPTLPPSGVSDGHIIPHCDACNE